MEGVVFRKSSKYFPARYLRLGVTILKIILKSRYEYLLRSRLYDIYIIRKWDSTFWFFTLEFKYCRMYQKL